MSTGKMLLIIHAKICNYEASYYQKTEMVKQSFDNGQKGELVLNMSFILRKALCILAVCSNRRLTGIRKPHLFPEAEGIVLFLVSYLIIE